MSKDWWDDSPLHPANRNDDDNDYTYPFDEGDEYWTIEDGQIVWSCWDSESEELYDKNPDMQLFETKQEAIQSLWDTTVSSYFNDKT
jgi:hypothetical protein